MPDCFSKSEVTDFMNFMKLPDGTSVVSDDMMEYLMPDDYTWLCKEMLKRIGVDVEAWNKERKEPDETEKH